MGPVRFASIVFEQNAASYRSDLDGNAGRSPVPPTPSPDTPQPKRRAFVQPTGQRRRAILKRLSIPLVRPNLRPARLKSWSWRNLSGHLLLVIFRFSFAHHQFYHSTVQWAVPLTTGHFCACFVTNPPRCVSVTQARSAVPPDADTGENQRVDNEQHGSPAKGLAGFGAAGSACRRQFACQVANVSLVR